VIALSSQPIDVGAVLAAVDGAGEGAAVLFVGRVRDRNRGQTVQWLDYEAYAGMAEAEMEALAGLARTQHGAHGVAIVHRTGRLQVGEVAVVIAVSAPHREQAFEACRWLIDTLKQRVPIWKRERSLGGEEWLSEHP